MEQLGRIPSHCGLEVSNFHAVPEVDGTNSQVFIIVNFEKKLVLIGGTSYAGEIKKSIFTVLNYLLPQSHILPMHCSANMGPGGVLIARKTWKDPNAYDAKAKGPAGRFIENFRQFANNLPVAVQEGSPRVG